MPAATAAFRKATLAAVLRSRLVPRPTRATSLSPNRILTLIVLTGGEDVRDPGGSVHELREQPPFRRQEIFAEPVVDPDPVLLRLDQPCLPQLAHMVRDRRLAQFEGGCEVADAHRRLRAPERCDHREPCRVGKRL